MDLFDRAQLIEERQRQVAIAAALPPASIGPSAEYCHVCDEPIPKERRQAEPGCTLCVDCKAVTERFPGRTP